MSFGKSSKKVFFFLVFVLMALVAIFFYLNTNRIKIKHIVLITIDTLRADHLSCYGYPRKTSPFIDSLASKGVVFENAFSQCATTAPSHASIMTGLYPTEHRVVANGYILDDSFLTLAEILSDNGIKTAAFTSTDRHFHASNIDQGFDFYEEPSDTKKTYNLKYRPARLTINNVILWLENFDADKKLFLWIHLFDPHTPHIAPGEYFNEIKKDTNEKSMRDFLLKRGVNLEMFNDSVDDYYKYVTGYDAEIKYVDDEIKRLYGVFNRKGLNKDSLWIITSDHGECLGQHNWLQHGKYLYKEAINTPLIFYSDKTDYIMKVDKVVENFDIFSTVLDAAGITKEISQKNESISLWGILSSGDLSLEREYAFSERRFYKKRKNYTFNGKVWKDFYDKGLQQSLVSGKYHYIYRSEYKDECYDLKNDPYEISDLKRNNDPRFQELRKMIFKIFHGFSGYLKLKTKKSDKRVFKKLRSLGYIQ